MATLHPRRLRVGVVGLGRLWEARHRPALARLSGRFRVVALYDQVARRAEVEAAGLRVAASRGIEALVARPDVDVVYLLAPQWFGLHAATLAAEAGKAIYCALPPAADPSGLEALAGVVRARGVAFVPELARRHYPATRRLRELLADRLGRPRLILGSIRLQGYDRYHPPGPATQLAPAPLAVDPGGYLLDWCRCVLGAEPTRVAGFGGAVRAESDPAMGPDFESVSAEFEGGALAQIALIRHDRATWGEAPRFLPTPGFQVFAERGAAWVEMPDRVRWTDGEAVHDERLPADPSIGEALNDHLHRRLVGEPSVAPTIDDALVIARLVAGFRAATPDGAGPVGGPAGPGA